MCHFHGAKIIAVIVFYELLYCDHINFKKGKEEKRSTHSIVRFGLDGIRRPGHGMVSHRLETHFRLLPLRR
jgi:hypothetical protein